MQVPAETFFKSRIRATMAFKTEGCATELLFAIDMMSLVSLDSSIPFIPTGTALHAGLHPDTPFKKNIRAAVSYLIPKLTETSEEIFNKHLKFDHIRGNYFSQFLASMSTKMLRFMHFDFFDFLAYCTLLCMLGVAMQKMGVNTAPNYCVEEIVRFSKFCTVTAVFKYDMWGALEKYAVRIN